MLKLATMEAILRNSGASRVSEDAKEAMQKVLEGMGEELGKKAVRFALHAGRKTVTKEDVMMASKQ